LKGSKVTKAFLGFLGLINLLTSRHFPWFLFPAGGWGIGLIFHFLSAYGPLGGAMSVEKEYQKLKKKQEKEARKESFFIGRDFAISGGTDA